MKQIHDFLHLYLGGQVELVESYTDGMISFEKGKRLELTPEVLLQVHCGYMKVIPILRPLSDMTDEEAIAIAKMGDSMIKFSKEDIDVIRDDYLIQVIWKDVEQGEKRFMIRTTGEFLTHITPIYNFQYITTFLLKNNFDLFGLHEAGLCLYK